MAKSKALAAAAIIVVGLAASCSDKKAQEPVAMLVNGQTVTLEQVSEAAEFFSRQQTALSPENVFGPDNGELRRGAARQLAANLLMVEMTKTMGWKADSARVERMAARFIAQFPDRETFLEQLKEMGESEESMREGMAEEILLDSLMTMVSNTAPPVTDDEVSAFYEANKNRYAAPASVRASQIIFALHIADDTAKIRETMEKAVQVKAKAKAGENFDTLIKTYSSYPASGDMGWFKEGDLIPELEGIIFSLKKDEVSDLVPSSMGVHIIKKTEEQEPRLMGFDEVSGSIKKSLELSKKGKRLNEFVDSLIGAADIKYFDKTLKPVAVERP